MACQHPLIDSHVHFYDRSRAEGTLWPPAASSYPSAAFSSDLIEYARPQKVDGVILVETGSRNVDDEWLLDLARRDPRILGVVAHLQPGEPGFKQRLKEYSGIAKLKGIRLRPIDHYDLKCSELKRHLALLSNYGLSLELGATSNRKMAEFIELAKTLPEISCGLTHLGHPIIDGKEPKDAWRDLILQFAALPNTFCKSTSLIDFTRERPAPENPDYYRPVVEFVVEAFGEGRMVFGSNWPRSSSPGNYLANVCLYQQVLDGINLQPTNFFSENARRIYKLDQDVSTANPNIGDTFNKSNPTPWSCSK